MDTTYGRDTSTRAVVEGTTSNCQLLLNASKSPCHMQQIAQQPLHCKALQLTSSPSCSSTLDARTHAGAAAAACRSIWQRPACSASHNVLLGMEHDGCKQVWQAGVVKLNSQKPSHAPCEHDGPRVLPQLLPATTLSHLASHTFCQTMHPKLSVHLCNPPAAWETQPQHLRLAVLAPLLVLQPAEAHNSHKHI